MKSKYEIIKVLNILRIKTDPTFEPEIDIGFHYDDKITKLEKDKTLVVKQITNEAWSDETKARGVFFIEEKNRDKKGITLTKSDCGKLAIILKEISD